MSKTASSLDFVPEVENVQPTVPLADHLGTSGIFTFLRFRLTLASAPAAGASQGGWTGCGGGPSSSGYGGDAEYILSSGSSATTVNITQSGNGYFSAMAMAIKFTAAASAPPAQQMPTGVG